MKHKKTFVAPIAGGLYGKLLDYPRLYAYPSDPEPPPGNGFIILDSGAFGMAKAGKIIDNHHMRKLAEHYKKFNASNEFSVIGIAPDVFMDYRQTMLNYQWWHDNIGMAVSPVIQFSNNTRDIATIIKQCLFYKKFGDCKFLAISNPSLNSCKASDLMVGILKIIKGITNADWLHCLGAGWSVPDVIGWLNIGFDSADSIAYYTDAKDGLQWGQTSKTVNSTEKWQDLAVQNHSEIMRNLQ
jgi:queuine/archaeosine tRNA-ribosyltransferase